MGQTKRHKATSKPLRKLNRRTTGYIFLGVNHGREHSVAELDEQGLVDDHFFNELRATYYNVKGYVKRFLSIWRFTDCDFVKLEEFDHDGSLSRGQGLPENDPKYQYVPKPRKPSDPMPPPDPHEFKVRFDSCYGGDQRPTHIFLSRNSKVCRPDDDALERLPSGPRRARLRS